MEWKTKLTELLGIRYPIIQGSFAGFGDSRLATAVSDAGGLGMITAGALKTPENLQKDIKRARSITDRPIAVNLTVGTCPYIDEMRDVVIGEKIPVVETSAYNAKEHGKKLKEAGIVWIHKVATVEHALVAAKQGADAVVIVGIEGTGFKSIRQLPISTAIPMAVNQMDVPVVAAGGIGSGRGLLSAFALGACGIYMGTAFMATKECPIPEGYKKRLVELSPADPEIRDKVLAPPDPEKVKKVMEKRGRVDEHEWLSQVESALAKEPEVGRVEQTRDTFEVLKLSPGSLAVGFLEKICTVGELIDEIIREAEVVLTQCDLCKS